jgi:hypothetical protein
MVKAQAAALLVQGVEVFFPTQAGKTALLRGLLGPTPAAGSRQAARHGRVDAKGAGGAEADPGWLTARRYLLHPLLRRLAANEVAAQLVPHPAAASTLPATAAETAAWAASAKVLLSLLRLLVDHLAAAAAPAFAPVGPTELAAAAEETSMLLTKLLLMLQRHLASWAMRDGPATAPATALPGSAESKGSGAEESPLEPGASRAVAAAAATLARPPTAAWACLFAYARLLLVRSEALVERAGVRPSNVGATALPSDVGAPESASSLPPPPAGLHRSLVGQVLPALLASLLPFAPNPLAARVLLPSLAAFAITFDSACLALDPAFAAADAAYLAFRASTSASASTSAGAVEGAGGVAGALGGAGARAEPVAPRLSWSLALLKSSAYLSGALAGALVASPAGDAAIAACPRWLLASPILKRGLTAPNLRLLEPLRRRHRHGDDGPPNVAFAATTEAARAAARSSATPSPPPPDREASEGSALACALASPEAPLAAWLRAAYGALDHGYRLLSGQALRGHHGPAFGALEQALFAALLHHDGLVGHAALVAAALAKDAAAGAAAGRPSTVRPSTSLLAVWRIVSEVHGVPRGVKCGALFLKFHRRPRSFMLLSPLVTTPRSVRFESSPSRLSHEPPGPPCPCLEPLGQCGLVGVSHVVNRSTKPALLTRGGPRETRHPPPTGKHLALAAAE